MSLEVPDYLQARICEIINVDFEAAERRRTWAAVLGARIFPDGNQWCCLYGGNLQDGVAGFGDSPIDAIQAFEAAMYEKHPRAISPQGGS